MTVITVVAAIAIVTAIVQFLKKWFPRIVQGPVAVALVVLASVGVTAYKFLSEGIPLSFAAATFLVQVIVGVMSGYELIKVVAGKKST